MRYAESRGHEFDPIIPNAYQYRDYVIRALGDDVPYDRLLTEHIAGDLMKTPRLHPARRFNESILGTGFWFLGEEVHSPVDIRADQADRFDNRIDVMAKTFLGLTVSCARCHDHKFDAISAKDYYALYGYLSSSNYRQVRFDSLEQNKAVARDLWKVRHEKSSEVAKLLGSALHTDTRGYLLAAREAINGGRPVAARASDVVLTNSPATNLDSPQIARIAREHKLDAKRLGLWISAILAAKAAPADPLHAFAKGSFRASASKSKAPNVVVDFRSAAWLPDDVTFGPGPTLAGSLRITGTPERPVIQVAERTAGAFDPFWAGLKIARESETDYGSLGSHGRPGRTLRTPTFALTTGKLHYLVRGSGTVYASVGSHTLIGGPLHARLVQSFGPSASYRWVSHDLSVYAGQSVHLEFTADDKADLAVALVVQGDPGPVDSPIAALDRLVSGASTPTALAAGYDRLFRQVADQLRRGDLAEGGQARLAAWMVRHGDLFASDTSWTRPAAELLEEEAKFSLRIQKVSRLAPAMQDGSGVDEYVFIRGSHRAVGPTVPRRFLEALGGSDAAAPRGSGRLELAQKMLDTQRNPLVARVAVNRVWQMLFGVGLVKTAEDFGVQGEPPSHPDLLDWLAVEYRESGWDTKRLLRLIVTSRAYRQSSRVTPELARLDPDNRLLARAPRLRLSAEMIRDQALAASGLLVERLGGPSVKPYQPGGLWEELADTPYVRDGGPDLYRRGLYTYWKRTVAPPGAVTFDAAGRETCSVLDSRTNTPLQALNLLNDVTYVEASRVLAARVMHAAKTPDDRVALTFRLVLARAPTVEERALLRSALDRHLTRYRRDTSAAKKLLAIGESLRDDRLDLAEHAAYTALASVILNLDEAVTRE